MSTDWEPLVIDNGTYMMKAGFAGDSSPRTVFPTITGKSRHKEIMIGMGQKDKYVGDEAVSKRGILSLKYPMEYGLIINWDDMQTVWHHTFYNELRVLPEDHQVLLTESALNTNTNREKMSEIMFETFNTPSIYIIAQELLSLYRSYINSSTGVVINSGCDVTNIVPIYNGSILKHAVLQLHIGGKHLCTYLEKILTESGYSFSSGFGYGVIEDMKKRTGYVAIDYEKEMNKNKNDIGTSYQLPNGQVINIDIERFKCCEPFFKPSLLGIESKGIHELLHESVMQCDGELRCDIFNNVLLNGGGMNFDGMKERLKKEMSLFKVNIDLVNGYIKRYYPKRSINKDVVDIIHNHCRTDVRIDAPAERWFSTWIGGSVVCQLSDFQQKWISKEEYQEFGANIVQRKCIGI